MNDKGVTLIELILVLALIGIVSAIGFLSSGGMRESYQLNGAARQIFGDMQLARLQAIKESKPMAVEFTGNTYAIRDLATDAILKNVNLATDYRHITALVTGNGGLTDDRQVFFPNGTASSGINSPASAKITLTNGSNVRSVCISRSTGNLRIVRSNTCGS